MVSKWESGITCRSYISSLLFLLTIGTVQLGVVDAGGVAYHDKAPDDINPQHRIYSTQVEHGEQQPRTSLLCPKNLFLAKILYRIYIQGEQEGKKSIQEEDPGVTVIDLRSHLEEIFSERIEWLINRGLAEGGIKELVDSNPCDVQRLIGGDEFLQCNGYDTIHSTSSSISDCEKYSQNVTSSVEELCTSHTEDTEHMNLYAKLKGYHSYFLSMKHKTRGRLSKGKLDQNFWAARDHFLGPCPTLLYCLGHQACLFHFGNKFCQNDPLPGSRKRIQIRLVCHDDSHEANIEQEVKDFIEGKLNLNTSLTDLENYHLKSITDHMHNLRYSTVFLRHRHKLVELGPPEKNVIDEKEVFEKGCPPVQEAIKIGYRGVCREAPVNLKHDTSLMWTHIARASLPQCREELLQVYCAYKYNAQAQCLPPFMLQQTENDNLAPYGSDSSWTWSFQAFPENGQRFSDEQYLKIFNNPLMDIIPARLGFNILAHDNSQLVMDLLAQLFRPQHYYAIIMDSSADKSRAELVRLVAEKYPGSTNINVLPSQRSFASSWGSSYIVRAEMEGYEELLRMGVWDFSINLSGTCLALRDVDDLAAALAPYRGQSFIRTFDMGGSMNLPDHERLLQVWHSCGRHVYNTLVKRGFPAAKLGIYTQNNYQILSWQFTEYLVSRTAHALELQWLEFYMMTSFVPDEMYFRTILMNSEFRDKNLQYRFHHMKRYMGDDEEFLCRHAEEVDACGKGPAAYDRGDLDELIKESRLFFFARKFSHKLDDNTRKEVLRYQAVNGFYDAFPQSLPDELQSYLTTLAVQKLVEAGKITQPYTDVSVVRIQIVPKLESGDPCCHIFIRHFIQFYHEYKMLMHLNVTLDNGNTVSALTILVVNPDFVHQCYPGGHLRGIHVSSQGVQGGKERPVKGGSVLPMQPSSVVTKDNTGSLHVIFILETGTTPTKCTKSEVERNLDGLFYAKWPLPHIKNKASPPKKRSVFGSGSDGPTSLQFEVALLDPNGEVKVRENRTVNRRDLGNLNNEKTEVITQVEVNFNIKTDTLEPGRWTLQFKRRNEEYGYIYEQSILVLNENNDDSLNQDLKELYKIEKVVLQSQLESDHYYENIVKISTVVDTNKGKETGEGGILAKLGVDITYENARTLFHVVITIMAALAIMLH